MKNVLIEIGTEELPASAINNLANFIGQKLKDILNPDHLYLYFTPRRIAFLFKGVDDKRYEREEIIIGPPWKVSYDDSGNPTKALQKFLEKQKASIEDVFKISNERGEYAAIRKKITEKSPVEKVAEELESIVMSSPLPKRMRWDGSGLTFLRPIRWLVFLCGGEVIEAKLGNIKSDRVTRGHRILHPEPFPINDEEEYEEKLLEKDVIASFEKRREIIERELNSKARSLGGEPVYVEGLLDEVTNMVEKPFIIVGKFEEKYLELPDLVIITVSAHHQRFFCVRDQKGNLLPYFLAVSNNGNNEEVVRSGYERVLRARLEDALFFFREDLKKPLKDRVDLLKGVLQHPKIGTLYDKIQRLKDIALKIAKDLNFDDEKLRKIERGAYLCKADVVTEMVNELDELQGYMGYVYALKHGEDEEVAKAIYEHYKPRSYTDTLPETDVGAVLSIADKFDDLISYFSVGEIPTGNSDPHGLRRAFFGILRIIYDRGWDVDLNRYGEAPDSLKQFAKQRIINYFEDIPYDILRAVTEVIDPFKPMSIKRAIEDLMSLRDREEFREMVDAYKRISRIIPKDFSLEDINEELFKEEAEIKLFEVYNKAKETGKLEDLYVLVPYINKFFEEVLVMDKNEAVRNNRLALLLKIKKLFMRFADLDQIVDKEVVRNG